MNVGLKKKNELGKEGEAVARRYLEQQGYRILHVNWHYGHYELDIIARRPDLLVVVEVKARSYQRIIEPEDAVDNAKIRRIVAAADAYVQTFDIDLPVQFDILSIIKNKDGTYHVEHIDDAFYAPCQ